VTAPGLSVVVPICATTFFGAVAGDRVFLSLAFQRHSSPHLSLFFHLSHPSFELAASKFLASLDLFIALPFVISAASFQLVSCLGGDSIFLFFPDKKPPSYLPVGFFLDHRIRFIVQVATPPLSFVNFLEQKSRSIIHLVPYYSSWTIRLNHVILMTSMTFRKWPSLNYLCSQVVIQSL